MYCVLIATTETIALARAKGAGDLDCVVLLAKIRFLVHTVKQPLGEF